MRPTDEEDGAAAGRLTALVVNNDDGVRLMLCEMLHVLGFDTVASGSAVKALALLEAVASYDLLVTDVRMPGDMDGAELASAARALRPTMKIIVVTGFGGQSMAQIPDGTPILSKPFVTSELKEQIEKLRRHS